MSFSACHPAKVQVATASLFFFCPHHPCHSSFWCTCTLSQLLHWTLLPFFKTLEFRISTSVFVTWSLPPHTVLRFEPKSSSHCIQLLSEGRSGTQYTSPTQSFCWRPSQWTPHLQPIVWIWRCSSELHCKASETDFSLSSNIPIFSNIIPKFWMNLLCSSLVS